MTNKEILKFLKDSIYTVVEGLKVEVWVTPEPVPFVNRFSGDHKVLTMGDKWGSLFDCGWFHFTGKVPGINKLTVPVLLIDVNGELLLVDENGEPLRGLTAKSSLFDRTLGEPVKSVFRLPGVLKPGDLFEFWGDAGCNDLFGELQGNGTLKKAEIAVCREDIRSLYYDFEFLENWMENITKDNPHYKGINNALEAAFSGISELTEINVTGADKAIKNIFSQLTLADNIKITAIGHSHLDLAWLWPIRETRRKIGRTLSTVIDLMDRYPDYVYGISQPQLLQWVKEDFPVLFSRVKENVKKGRIEVLGAMWVEADTNLPSGESLVRQILYGKRFWKEEFSLEIDNLWLPDVFGYSGSLPQICRQTGVRYFSTMKLSWNTINKFPFHSFVWEGIDGSSVLAHMLPEETYNGPADPGSLFKIIDNYSEKDISHHALMVFGIGDGGGGPGAEHLERLDRMKYTSDPDRIIQRKVSDFFPEWASESDMFPVWRGELYLEKHQGTYTTEAAGKWYNRKMEINLRKMEFISVLSMFYTRGTHFFVYPADKLEKLWKEVLLYQFHDILPGSSIKRVYDESWKRYDSMLVESKSYIEEAEKDLIRSLGFIPIERSVCDNELMIAGINYLSWDINKWIFINNSWVEITIPAMGCAVQICNKDYKNECNFKWNDSFMENELISIKFARDGSILSVFDIENQREVLVPGYRGNFLVVYNDSGDAWDFFPDYRTDKSEKFTLLESSIKKNGPELINHQVYRYEKSILTQDIVLTANNRKIDFRTGISWVTPAKMVRTSFPVDVPDGKAMCEIQFGAIERPVKSDNSRDMAMDEISAHRWIDISNDNFGVALLNNSKYGHRVKDGILDLALLRSVPYPGPVEGYTDIGKHEFIYSLFPHKGNYGEGGVVRAACELNSPLKVYQIKKTAKKYYHSFFSTGDSSLVISTIKRSEKSDDIIIRLYESAGKSVSTWLEAEIFRHQFPLSPPPVKAALVNLLEEFQKPLEIINNRIPLRAGPYEIISVRIGFIN